MTVGRALPGPVGWIGTGRMGIAMVERLLAADVAVQVWNRTAANAAPLVAAGAEQVGRPADLAPCAVVFSMVADDAALDELSGEKGLFSGPQTSARRTPGVWVECSTVSIAASERAAGAAAAHGFEFVCAPVSGSPGVVHAGNAIFAVSGPAPAQRQIEPLLAAIGRGVHDVGDGHQARVVKLCTNLLIAITAEALSEATVLGERSGVRRPELLAFINDSAIGSTFSKYKSEALVDLDFTPSFSPEGQRKDLRLALDLGRDGGVSMPVAAATEVVFSQLIGSGLGADRDFIALVLQVARDSGITLAAEPPP